MIDVNRLFIGIVLLDHNESFVEEAGEQQRTKASLNQVNTYHSAIMTQRQRSSTLLVVGLFVLLCSGMAEAWATPSSIQRRRHGSSYTRLYNFLDQFHGESDSAYFKRVTAAASDPVTFERMVLNQQRENETPSSAAAAGHQGRSARRGDRVTVAVPVGFAHGEISPERGAPLRGGLRAVRHQSPEDLFRWQAGLPGLSLYPMSRQ